GPFVLPSAGRDPGARFPEPRSLDARAARSPRPDRARERRRGLPRQGCAHERRQLPQLLPAPGRVPAARRSGLLVELLPPRLCRQGGRNMASRILILGATSGIAEATA